MKLLFCYLKHLRFPEIRTCETTDKLGWVIKETKEKNVQHVTSITHEDLHLFAVRCSAFLY
jgi:hypothetical protein